MFDKIKNIIAFKKWKKIKANCKDCKSSEDFYNPKGLGYIADAYKGDNLEWCNHNYDGFNSYTCTFDNCPKRKK